MAKSKKTTGRRVTASERDWETCVEPECDNRVTRFVLGDFYCTRHTPPPTPVTNRCPDCGTGDVGDHRLSCNARPTFCLECEYPTFEGLTLCDRCWMNEGCGCDEDCPLCEGGDHDACSPCAIARSAGVADAR